MLTRFFTLLILLTLTGCQSSKTIVNGIDERDANEIVVLLAQKKITAYKIQQKAAQAGAGPRAILWDITVNPDQVEQAMAILAQNGLPRTRNPNLIDLFSAQGLVPSDISEKIRYRAGLADELDNMIRKMDGIVDSEVQLSFPQQDVFNPNAPLPPITASVFVKHTGILDDPNAQLAPKIKQLVSGAISGLSYDNVTVIPIRARFAIPSSMIIQVAPQEYKHVFGFTVENQSVDAFRMFLLAFGLTIVVFIFCFSWLIWKIKPITKRRGGFRMLFRMEPLPEPSADETVTLKEEKEEPKTS